MKGVEESKTREPLDILVCKYVRCDRIRRVETTRAHSQWCLVNNATPRLVPVVFVLFHRMPDW
jgi:hypothetical protein